jgi:hypothetical protein
MPDGQQLFAADHGDEIWTCSFSPDRRRLATSGGDSKIRAFKLDLEEDELVLPHPSWTWACKLFPDGTRLLTGCDDGRLRVFDTATTSKEGRANLPLTVVAAFPIQHGISPAGYFSLPARDETLACDVRWRNADYPLTLLYEHLNRPDHVAAELRGEAVPDIYGVLRREFPEVLFPECRPGAE